MILKVFFLAGLLLRFRSHGTQARPAGHPKEGLSSLVECSKETATDDLADAWEPAASSVPNSNGRRRHHTGVRSVQQCARVPPIEVLRARG